MSFRENLKRARSHIVFMAALASGLGLIVFLEHQSTAGASVVATDVELAEPPAPVPTALELFNDVAPLPLAAPRPLTEQELDYARTAWIYFANNTNPETGLANSADAYPSTTMWETGAYFTAILSANLLGILETDEALARLSKTIETLQTLPLFEDTLPNKAYHTVTAGMVNYANQPSELGLGWSALDVARMMSALGMMRTHYPTLATEIEALVDTWDVAAMVDDGQLFGTNVIEGEIHLNQEGRVGYEQYAARAMQRFGYDMYSAYETGEKLMVKTVQGVLIPVDTRLHRGTHPAFTVSEPYILDGLEFGFDNRSHRFASSIYQAQENRYTTTGILTAVSESHVTGPPYFVYSTIWGGGDEWAVMAFNGDRYDSKRTVATKIAFAWNALFDTPYTQKLVEDLSHLHDPDAGWQEGLYEVDGSPNASITANTNATVLASLAFRAFGPLSHAKK